MNPLQDDLQSNDNHVEIGFAGLTASVGDRIGHYYQNETEAHELAVEFLAASLQTRAEKCVYLCDVATHESVERMLMARGIDVVQAVATGQLTMSNDRPSPIELERLLDDALADVGAGPFRIGWRFPYGDRIS